MLLKSVCRAENDLLSTRGKRHENELGEQPMEFRGYAICTQPRSGSNLLCQYLSSSGCLGHPLEYFNGPGRRALGLPDFPDSPVEQIREILRIGATDNIYAVKLFASQFEIISRSVRWTELLPNMRFVYLAREDVLGQAISWARAIQTAQYRSTQQAVAVAVYNAELIQTQLRTILHERALWEGYFARTGIIPLRIIYERFLEDPVMHVARVAALMKVNNVAIDERKIDLTMQRNATSDEWRRRFREDCGDPNVLHG
jgi:LPS sulfotransferase NodH